MHEEAITIGIGQSRKPRRRLLAGVREAARRRRIERAERLYSLRANGAAVLSLPGSDHSHLVRRPRGF